MLIELLGRRSKLGESLFPERVWRSAASTLRKVLEWLSPGSTVLWASLFQQELPANSSSISLSAGKSQGRDIQEAARVRRYMSCISAASLVLVLIDGRWPDSSASPGSAACTTLAMPPNTVADFKGGLVTISC